MKTQASIPIKLIAPKKYIVLAYYKVP